MRPLILLAALLAVCAAAETKLGKPLTLKHDLSIAELLQHPDGFVGKTVQVRGKVSEVCEMMGCWMNLTDTTADNKSVRVKVKDGEIVFPKTAIGKVAVAEGPFVKIEMTREQVVAQMKHESEENGKKFDPASVKSGKTTYQIQGTGAVILD
jgi:hypothetical protein